MSSWKQYIIVNKGVGMSPGKLAAQVSHASMAFLTNKMRQNACVVETGLDFQPVEMAHYEFMLPLDMHEGWIEGIFTKVILEAKNEARMVRLVEDLVAAGMVEGKDFFRVIDSGLTEFDGVKTWTCIGLRPIDTDVETEVAQRLRKLQLLH